MAKEIAALKVEKVGCASTAAADPNAHCKLRGVHWSAGSVPAWRHPWQTCLPQRDMTAYGGASFHHNKRFHQDGHGRVCTPQRKTESQLAGLLRKGDKEQSASVLAAAEGKAAANGRLVCLGRAGGVAVQRRCGPRDAGETHISRGGEE